MIRFVKKTIGDFEGDRDILMEIPCSLVATIERTDIRLI